MALVEHTFLVVLPPVPNPVRIAAHQKVRFKAARKEKEKEREKEERKADRARRGLPDEEEGEEGEPDDLAGVPAPGRPM